MDRARANPGSEIVFARVLQAAREAGMDGDSLRRLLGHEAWAERSWIWSQIMRSVRLPGFPIRVAQLYSVGEIGPLGMVAQVAPDLRSAFERLVHYQHVLTGSALGRIREARARGVSVFEVLAVEGSGLGARCRREEMVASGLKLARDIAQAPVRPLRVCFAHPAPHDTCEHEAFFDCPVSFGERYDGLEFEPETLATPLPGADPELSEFWVEHLRSVAGDPPGTSSTLEGRVRQAIRASAGKSSLSMEAIAQGLGMSPRTLRRRLLESGSRYHELLDRVRRELADELLAAPDRKVWEVAALLGFSDPSAFHRAYVRWTGQTPRRAAVRSRTHPDVRGNA